MVLNKNENYDKIVTLDTDYKDIDSLLKEVNSEPFLSNRRKKARERAVNRGFTDEYHMEGYLYFNRLDNSQYSGYDVDILNLTSWGED